MKGVQDLVTKHEEMIIQQVNVLQENASDSEDDNLTDNRLAFIAKIHKHNLAEQVFEVSAEKIRLIDQQTDLNTCAFFLDALAWLYSTRVDKTYQDSLKLKCNLLKLYEAPLTQKKKKEKKQSTSKQKNQKQTYKEISHYGDNTLDFKQQEVHYDTVQLNPFYNITSRQLDQQNLGSLISYKPELTKDFAIILDPDQMREFQQTLTHTGFIKLEVETSNMDYQPLFQSDIDFEFNQINEFRDRYTYLLKKQQQQKVVGLLLQNQLDTFIFSNKVQKEYEEKNQNILLQEDEEERVYLSEEVQINDQQFDVVQQIENENQQLNDQQQMDNINEQNQMIDQSQKDLQNNQQQDIQQIDMENNNQLNNIIDNNIEQQQNVTQFQPQDQDKNNQQLDDIPFEDIPDFQQIGDEWEQQYLEEQQKDKQDIQQQFEVQDKEVVSKQKIPYKSRAFHFDDVYSYERTELNSVISEPHKLNRNVRIKYLAEDSIATFTMERFFEFFVKEVIFDVDFEEALNYEDFAQIDNSNIINQSIEFEDQIHEAQEEEKQNIEKEEISQYTFPFKIITKTQEPFSIKQLQQIVDRAIDSLKSPVSFQILYKSLPSITNQTISKQKLFAALLFIVKENKKYNFMTEFQNLKELQIIKQ